MVCRSVLLVIVWLWYPHVFISQCTQTTGYLTEWEAYAKKQQTLYEEELLKSQHLASEIDVAKKAAEETSQQLQDVSS